MSKFTTRVELHGADWSEDYEKLHIEMRKEGFSTTITSGDKKITYDLPRAEYNKMGNFTIAQVLASAKKAASKVSNDYAVLVTGEKSRKWYNLKEAK